MNNERKPPVQGGGGAGFVAGLFGSRIENLRSAVQKKKRGGGERSFVISQFVEEINKERAAEKRKPMTERQVRHVAVILSAIKSVGELYEFLSECRDYKRRTPGGSVGKRLYGGSKIRK